MFSELKKLHKSGTDLDETGDQSSGLTAYIANDRFNELEVPFRALIEEWTGLLADSGLVKNLVTQSGEKSAVDDEG